MRFCPFCSAENPSEATHCAACARRLPPLPPRKQRTQSVPIGAAAGGADPSAVVAPAPSLASSPAPSPAGLPAPRARPASIPPPSRGRPASIPPPTPPPRASSAPPLTSSGLVPGPAGARRQTAPPPSRDPDGPSRRKTDSFAGAPAPALAPSVGPAAPTATAAPTPIPGHAPRAESITPLPPPPTVTRPPELPPPPPEAAIGAAIAASGSPTPTPAVIRDATSVDPPPTRIARPTELADRPFTPPAVIPVPEVPEPGLLNAVRYAITFMRARWQRRGAIKHLGEEIKQDTAALDLVLGTLGHEARKLKIDSRALTAENGAIDAVEERKGKLDHANADLASRKNDETAKFAEVEKDWLGKVADAERLHEDAAAELANYEGQRRSLRDKRKEVERRQKAYLKAAEDRDTEAGNSPMGDVRGELRRAAEGHRREAAELEPERQDLDRKLSAIDRPLGQAQAKVDAARAELESARRSLHDAREGHRHRLAEIEAEQGRKAREIALADAEIQRRLVTLGTLINLNRIEHPGFGELYERIDRLRMAIGSRTTEIDKLTAERDAYDKGSLVRGFVTLGGGVVLLITLVVIVLAVS